MLSASPSTRHRTPVRLPVRLAVLTAWILAGVVLGLALVWWLIRPQSVGFGVASGPWRVSLLAGSAEADPLTRARVAIGGLLALNRSETMYYVASTDSLGKPLRSRCNYKVSGVPPQARWWSVTAYADDYFLFDDDKQRYSLSGKTAKLDAAGKFALRIGPEGPADASMAWVPTPGDRGVILTLRVYNPSSELQATPSNLVAPVIEQQGACA